ncbi:hypothetical protein GCM10027275_11420 [Rhabdobacter roseus]|uniref:Uncharacterized protein n=1 Tax=Rhabdobacter roseus TaxID=1655419 RepID=A0A840THV7_9BACT|nr:hypothetical protein [Rhabdobacter roseus]MBB5283054.1 hypothetical protein [Rhabdobacter roseus]
MSKKDIQFFSPADNSVQTKTKAKVEKNELPTCSISSKGQLIFPSNTLEELGVGLESTFRIGANTRKKVLTSIFLVEADPSDEFAFAIVKRGRGYSIPLKGILTKQGVDFENTGFVYAAKPFEYQGSQNSFELKLIESEPRKKA